MLKIDVDPNIRFLRNHEILLCGDVLKWLSSNRCVSFPYFPVLLHIEGIHEYDFCVVDVAEVVFHHMSFCEQTLVDIDVAFHFCTYCCLTLIVRVQIGSAHYQLPER